MSTIDLMILGILSEAPRSAYEINQHIAEKQVSRLLKISDPAVYKSCKRMHQRGFLVGTTVKEGAQPAKVVYDLSADGKKRFHELMEFYASDVKPFFIEFNTFIWNLDRVDKKEGLKLLSRLSDELKELEAWIVEHEKEASKSVSFPTRMVIKQYAMLISTQVAWVEEAIREFVKTR